MRGGPCLLPWQPGVPHVRGPTPPAPIVAPRADAVPIANSPIINHYFTHAQELSTPLVNAKISNPSWCCVWVQPVLTSQFLGDSTVKDVAALVAPILLLNKPVLMQSVCLHALIWPRVLWAFKVALVRAGP